MNRRGRHVVARRAALAVGILLPAMLTACGHEGAGPGAASAGLPAVVKVVSINAQTGQVSFAGIPATRGAQVAVDEITRTKFLGDTTIEVKYLDSTGTPQTAAGLAAQAVASRQYSAILGGILTTEAFTVAPIAQKGKVPVIFTQSNGDGVVIGDYTFRATASFTRYYDVMGTYLRNKGVKTIALLYNSDVASYQELATLIGSWTAKFGISVVADKSVVSSTQDFTAPIASLVSAKPDAVAKFLLGTANATALQQLRQAGFDGPVIATNSDSGGNIAGAGSAGAGAAWPTDFSSAQTDRVATDFTAAYKAKFNGAAPNPYAAEGYDAVWWLARAIKVAGRATPADIQRGLVFVAKMGFTGATGPITFDGNEFTLRTPKVVAWDGRAERLVKP
ncbi:ABC transporter substrate-binding protein [Amycolatopsis sp. NPDC005232]|uniref:ABC transporter substrate-binding protein n=1 Tax=Amycolatopsis sp. NPDC005232 TaxID=3157027 RepID=UPI00339F9C9E